MFIKGLFEVNIHTYPALQALITAEIYNINWLPQGEQRCFGATEIMTSFYRQEIFYNFFAKPDLKHSTKEQSLPDRSEDDNDSSKKLHPFP